MYYFISFAVLYTDLSFNRLKTLDRDLFEDSLSHYPTGEFNVTGNPIQCDCNLKWIYDVRVSERKANSTFPNIHGIPCQENLMQHLVDCPVFNHSPCHIDWTYTDEFC